MLYEKNKKSPALDKELFKSPTADYRATPFWAWNCELDRDELLRQIDIFKEMGYGGYHMHVRAGMATTYMSDEFMSLIKACVKHGKEKEMISWLYDEDRWPSGYAGGFVTKDKAFRKRHIEFVADHALIEGDDPIALAHFDIILDENDCLKSYKTISEDETSEGVRWTAYRTLDKGTLRFGNQTYVDTLNKKAIEKFIEITHEAYAREVGDEFGKSIPAIFTDEPQHTHKDTFNYAGGKDKATFPWTDDLEETYKAAYGDSLVEHLPELFWELPDGEVSLTRYRYHDHVTERFVSAFSDTIGQWCDEHGIKFTGHVLNEKTLRSQTRSVGEAMRFYRSFGIPGIDMLCNNFEFTTAKQCQSAAHQYGRDGMLSELDGVTGWDFDFRGHKMHGDWQAALGVTVRVPHLAWVSMKGKAKRDYPASISYQSSWYKEYAYIEDHFARVATALTRGKPMVRVGVIHPIETYWLHWGPLDQTSPIREKLERNFDNATQWLLRGNIDFDYICESLLPSLNEKGGAPLRVGEMEYDVIVVPECETLRSTTLECLEAFSKAGGKLIFMGEAPKYEDAKVSDRGAKLFKKSTCISFNRSSLLAELNEFRYIEISNKKTGALTNSLIHQLRRDTNGMWLFIAPCELQANKDIAHSSVISIKIKGEYSPELWDTQSGEIKQVSFTRKDGYTVISLRLYDYDSALLFLEDGNAKEPVSLPKAQSEAVLENTPSEVEYELTEPNVLSLDIAKYALDNNALCDKEEVMRIYNIMCAEAGYDKGLSTSQPWMLPDTPAEHTVTLEFEINSEIKVKGAMLALEDPDKTTVVFNGKTLKYDDKGYYTDRSIRKTPLPEIKKGKNILRITYPFGVRTTIERVYILGDFGVKVIGRNATITALTKTLAFDDITKQGLPFYGGTVKYIIPIECPEEGDYYITTPHYRAAVLGVYADGKRVDTIAYPPYSAKLGHLSAGKHEIVVEAFISRHNCFGHTHCANASLAWVGGPNCWSTKGAEWTYEYRLLTEGVISTPIFYKK